MAQLQPQLEVQGLPASPRFIVRVLNEGPQSCPACEQYLKLATIEQARKQLSLDPGAQGIAYEQCFLVVVEVNTKWALPPLKFGLVQFIGAGESLGVLYAQPAHVLPALSAGG